MHEMSIATALIRQVLAAVEANRVAKVRDLEVVTGALRLVVPEALKLAFQVVSQGTPAEGAVLTVTEEPARARCRSCGRVFACGLEDFRCRGCGLADVDFISGNDIVLKSMTCETEEDAPEP